MSVAIERLTGMGTYEETVPSDMRDVTDQWYGNAEVRESFAHMIAHVFQDHEMAIEAIDRPADGYVCGVVYDFRGNCGILFSVNQYAIEGTSCVPHAQALCRETRALNADRESNVAVCGYAEVEYFTQCLVHADAVFTNADSSYHVWVTKFDDGTHVQIAMSMRG